jgi:hypothetical protein
MLVTGSDGYTVPGPQGVPWYFSRLRERGQKKSLHDETLKQTYGRLGNTIFLGQS